MVVLIVVGRWGGQCGSSAGLGRHVRCEALSVRQVTGAQPRRGKGEPVAIQFLTHLLIWSPVAGVEQKELLLVGRQWQAEKKR